MGANQGAAGGARHAKQDSVGFAKAPPNSFRLLGDLMLVVPDVEAARLFYAKALGGMASQEANEEVVISTVGTRIRLHPLKAGSTQIGWPGHLHLWVSNLQHTLHACRCLEQHLGVNIVQTADHDTCGVVETLLLHDPSHQHMIMVRESPKGIAAKMGAKVEGAVDELPVQPKLLGIMEVVRRVPGGVTPALARFYRRFLFADVSEAEWGCAVHFSLGEALSQALVFVEDEELQENNTVDVEEADQQMEICMYMPSKERLTDAFMKCLDEGLTCSTLMDVELEHEFCICECIDPETQNRILSLRQVFRFSQRPASPFDRPKATATMKKTNSQQKKANEQARREMPNHEPEVTRTIENTNLTRNNAEEQEQFEMLNNEPGVTGTIENTNLTQNKAEEQEQFEMLNNEPEVTGQGLTPTRKFSLELLQDAGVWQALDVEQS